MQWLLNEVEDNKIKRKKDNLKKYWIKPKNENEHDPRGIKSYVESKYYTK